MSDNEQRLPTPEQIANRPRVEPRSTCVICWHSWPAVDNGVCDVCRRGLDKRALELVAENARLRNQIEVAMGYLEDATRDRGERIRLAQLTLEDKPDG